MNTKSAFIGLVLSTIVNLWIGIGAVLNNKPPKTKPMNLEGCTNLNKTINFATQFAKNQTDTSSFKLILVLIV
jgi:hypothetical protein